jgi:hypothetical protein
MLQARKRYRDLPLQGHTTSVFLKWNDVSDQDLSYFRIERKDYEGGEFVNIGTTSTQLGWNATGLIPQTSYWFRVVGYDRYGNRGTPSDAMEIVTQEDTSAPVVTGISPSPAAYSGSIPLSGWAQDNVSVQSFTFQYSTDAGTTWADIATLNPTNAPASAYVTFSWDTSALGEGVVAVRGQATDSAGNVSSSSPKVEYSIDRTAPAAPAGLAIDASTGRIDITWTKGTETDLAGYLVYRSIDGEDNYVLLASNVRTALSASTMIYADSNVEFGKTYYYMVKAADNAGNISSASEMNVSGTLLPDTQAPRIVSISPAQGSTMPANPTIGVFAADDYRLESVTLE